MEEISVHCISDPVLHLEPEMITGTDFVGGLKVCVDNEKLGKIRRCFSDPVLNSAQREEITGVDMVDGLKISLGYRRSQITSEVCRDNVEIDWDGEQADVPLLVGLLAQSLETLASVGMSPRRKRGPRSQRIPFLDLAQLQLGMRLGMHHQKLKSQDQMIGLNFADEKEANLFSHTVNEQLAKQHRKKVRMGGGGGGGQQQQTLQPVQQKQPKLPPPIPQKTGVPAFDLPKDKTKQNKTSDKNKRKLGKHQIGMPTDFKHIKHIDYEANKGMPELIDDNKLQGFFRVVGVSEQQLSDRRTRQFIYDFIERNGGVEKAVEEDKLYSSLPLPPPQVSANSTASHCMPPPLPNYPVSPPAPRRSLNTNATAPPPVPWSLHHILPPLPPNPSPRPPMPIPPLEQGAARSKKSPLPPLPLLANASVPPPTSSIPTLAKWGPPHREVPPPPSSPPTDLPPFGIAPHPPLPIPGGMPPPPPGGMPPPPPRGSMPPPPPGSMPPPPPPPSFPSPAPSDPHSTLMSQIRIGGGPLKKVKPTERQPVADSRNQLLEQIRGGFQLKNVKDQFEGAKDKCPQLDGMALLLNQALQIRAQAIQSESDDSDEGDEDEIDEWDDDNDNEDND
ncbi:actin nucleation-promoting factor WASL-like isoform X3 [Macrobrachium rosenbergii]|uniref:actin nucleation-promoting factor WASL-like isoform X3 n=1 Tax=Macrobrachium rosenbergii TaxID=79674 RepID=UPI0034D48F2E